MKSQALCHQRWQRLQGLLVAVIICFVAGCEEPIPQPQPVASQPSSQTQPTLPSEPEAVVDPGAIELQVVDMKGYEHAVAKLRGKVVLVDFWATWCGPCRKQFPHSVELHRKFQDRGFTVVSVSIDQMDDGETLDELKARVLDFLKEHQATFPNLVAPMSDLAPGDPAATDLLAQRFDLPGGSIPHYKLYDRRGELQRRFFTDPETGAGFQPHEIDVAIERLLDN